MALTEEQEQHLAQIKEKFLVDVDKK